MTLSFRPSTYDRTPSLYLKAYERCYQRMVKMLLSSTNNYQRKKYLQPLTYAFFEKPHQKKSSSISTLDERNFPHIHSVMLFHPETRFRWNEIQPELFSRFFVHLADTLPDELKNRLLELPQKQARETINDIWKSEPYDCRTLQSDPFLLSLDIQEIQNLKAVTVYSSDYASKQRNQDINATADSDLYVLLPVF